MTAIEIGRAAATVRIYRAYLLLADAMREANGEGPDDGDGDGAPLATRRVAARTANGIRFRRCGGGRQVIRKQSGRAY